MAAILRSRLFEFDFSGIEAVLLGYFAARQAKAPTATLIRVAKLGLHAYVSSHLVRKPVDLARPDDEVAAALQAIKKGFPFEYDMAKRTVHGTGYGMTPHGMVLMFPKLYKTLKDAERVQRVYFECAPEVPAFQTAVRVRAHEQGYLGGPPARGLSMLADSNAHPYGYKHYFYGVTSYRPISDSAAKTAQRNHVPVIDMNGRFYAIGWGEDSKACVAFYPQSTAAGILMEATIPLFAEPNHPSYIGDAYFGRTPLRAPIHDSLFLEVPPRQQDRVIEAVWTEMTRPIEEMPMDPRWQMGPFLTIGVEAKAGYSWDAMEKIAPPAAAAPLLPDPQITLASDTFYWPATEAEEEDVLDLALDLIPASV